MISSSPIPCPFFASILLLFKKILPFKSFTGLTLQELEYIYVIEISKIYEKHEVPRLSKSKNGKNRECNLGAIVRPFKLDLKRVLMLLVYYRLFYLTYTLTGFLFDLDQSSVYSGI
jgi:hypothetical protein